MKPPGEVRFFPEIDVRNGFCRWWVAMALLFAFGVELKTWSSMPLELLPALEVTL